ncbi:MAG TPA: sigma-54-dependent Fis family transcriptional regulator [Desulfuromonadales bacterium]|nr:sigma-54-dependent Fis family transcriptional regulator [Desulfuromonadales bacterium]
MPEKRTTYLPVLLVDDDITGCTMMALTLRQAGVENVRSISDSRQVLPFLQEQSASLILLDLMMPHLSGQELLIAIRREHPGIQVVVISGANELNLAVECMKLGALDYLNKPVESTRLIACVKNALKINAIQGELLSLKRRMLEGLLDHPAAFEAIKTHSSKMRALFQYTEVIACSPQPILITGETGVGKELMARAVHHLSGVRGEFVSINVAGLEDTTFSDTLFGHKKGAFTGADQVREGLIARAAGGTLFLDEIGDLEERSQIKLLRLLQEGEYYQVGSDSIKKSTARIVAVTNQNLPERVAEKLFRRDLYYRLYTHEIHLPPLRERTEDIPLLLDHFLQVAALSYHKKPPVIAVSAVSHLQGLSFPGNVRELKAMIFDAVARHTEGELTAKSFGGSMGEGAVVSGVVPANGSTEHSIDAIFGHFPTSHEVEEYLINEAMRRSAGNINSAAAMLGITRQTIANHRKKQGGTPVKAEKLGVIPMESLFNK